MIFSSERFVTTKVTFKKQHLNKAHNIFQYKNRIPHNPHGDKKMLCNALFRERARSTPFSEKRGRFSASYTTRNAPPMQPPQMEIFHPPKAINSTADWIPPLGFRPGGRTLSRGFSHTRVSFPTIYGGVCVHRGCGSHSCVAQLGTGVCSRNSGLGSMSRTMQMLFERTRNESFQMCSVVSLWKFHQCDLIIFDIIYHFINNYSYIIYKKIWCAIFF